MVGGVQRLLLKRLLNNIAFFFLQVNVTSSWIQLISSNEIICLCNDNNDNDHDGNDDDNNNINKNNSNINNNNRNFIY